MSKADTKTARHVKATRLEDFLSFAGRYNRAVNLERDLGDPEALSGYVPTPRTLFAVSRLLRALTETRACRAFTITAVYGTGKSAFALFLAHLFAVPKKPFRLPLEAAIRQGGQELQKQSKRIRSHLGKSGLEIAAASASRESISACVERALQNLTQGFSAARRRKAESVLQDASLNALEKLRAFVRGSPSGLLLIIDELGQALEHSILSDDAASLHLMQEIAELSEADGKPLLFIGLLHQSFSDYAARTGRREQEWQKVQGRFEDIPLQDSPENAMLLISKALQQKPGSSLVRAAKPWAALWKRNLPQFRDIGEDLLAKLYPLHPLSARVLPLLSIRFAQNERSLFNFLTGYEAHGFRSFLQNRSFGKGQMPTLKLHHLYDYFMDSVSAQFGWAARMTRFVEIHNIISESRGLPEEELRLLKTIGLLNMLALWGSLAASTEYVVYALLDRPDKKEFEKIQKKLNALLKRGLLVYRKREDAWRLWEGSDIDIEFEMERLREEFRLQEGLAPFLNRSLFLSPQIAQRHSFETGCLRYFEQAFVDGNELPLEGFAESPADGVLLMSLQPEGAGKMGPDCALAKKLHKPVLLLQSGAIQELHELVMERAILETLQDRNPNLKRDAVARKELQFRLRQNGEWIEQKYREIFALDHPALRIYYQGKPYRFGKTRRLRGALRYSKGALVSEICDLAYKIPGHKSAPYYSLHSELINRNHLSSQMARARKSLLLAMLANPQKAQFGLSGNGPEVSIYKALFEKTGLHRLDPKSKGYHLARPRPSSGIYAVYRRMEELCRSASKEAQNVEALFLELMRPPYGARLGVLPILLVCFLLQNENEFHLYKNGSFVPQLEEEEIELLCLRPEKFSLKRFVLKGLRADFFSELFQAFSGKSLPKIENSLGLLKPMLRFVRQLPAYTKKSGSLSKETRRLLLALEKTNDIDRLLFEEIPAAVGLPHLPEKPSATEDLRQLTRKVFACFTELQGAYPLLLKNARELLRQAFAVPEGQALEDSLQGRAYQLKGLVLQSDLRRLVEALSQRKEPRSWLEAVMTSIADSPPASWSDETLSRFEYQLSGLSRRFQNLEYMQAQNRRKGGTAFASPLVGITYPDGTEKREVFLIEKKTDKEKLISIYLKNSTKSLQSLRSNPRDLRALSVLLLEEALAAEAKSREPGALQEALAKDRQAGKAHLPPVDGLLPGLAGGASE